MASVPPTFFAHGASSGAAAFRLPSSRSPRAESLPAVDDHLVLPEVTRDEVVNGRKVIAMPAAPPHADQHVQLDFVIRAHVREGYVSASDLLTRVDIGSDFATDTCIRKEGIDPATGKRYLEEFAFEIVNDQSIGEVEERVKNLIRRGVRRVFGVFVRAREVAEWSAAKNAFEPLSMDGLIEDECLHRPFLVRAILEAAEADNAVARVLLDKGNPVLARAHAEAEAKGEAKGELKATRELLLRLVERVGLTLSDGARAHIDACQSADTLRGYVDDVLSAKTGADVAWLNAR